jgi:hypothetical protein
MRGISILSAFIATWLTVVLATVFKYLSMSSSQALD